MPISSATRNKLLLDEAAIDRCRSCDRLPALIARQSRQQVLSFVDRIEKAGMPGTVPNEIGTHRDDDVNTFGLLATDRHQQVEKRVKLFA